jgi:hypothetical protein
MRAAVTGRSCGTCWTSKVRGSILLSEPACLLYLVANLNYDALDLIERQRVGTSVVNIVSILNAKRAPAAMW